MSRVEWGAAEQVLSTHPRVVAAWAFGSAQGGDVRRGGDVDVGVLLAGEASLDELAELRADLQQALRQDDVDLVILNRASSILRFEALSARRIFCRDEAATAAFASLTAREYEDDVAFLRKGLASRSR
ncbi:MAG: nucleotidyltransferase domain-containing protein [Deferrisomatales bacterium]|nr:nucleotidyltransferase domain-containing protein [Deferrisomatales bacterium]